MLFVAIVLLLYFSYTYGTTYLRMGSFASRLNVCCNGIGSGSLSFHSNPSLLSCRIYLRLSCSRYVVHVARGSTGHGRYYLLFKAYGATELRFNLRSSLAIDGREEGGGGALEGINISSAERVIREFRTSIPSRGTKQNRPHLI